MRAYQVHIRLIGAALIVLAFSSVSEARWFRGRYAYYYIPAYPVCCTPTTQASPMPAVNIPAATSVPTPYPVNMAYQANKVPVPAPAAEPLPANSPAINNAPQYAPGAASGGWGVLPRNSWDYGRFPPFR